MSPAYNTRSSHHGTKTKKKPNKTKSEKNFQVTRLPEFSINTRDPPVLPLSAH